MFIVKSIGQQTCMACNRATECLLIESDDQRTRGWLCPNDFRRLVRVATVAAAATQGHPAAAQLTSSADK